MWFVGEMLLLPLGSWWRLGEGLGWEKMGKLKPGRSGGRGREGTVGYDDDDKTAEK